MGVEIGKPLACHKTVLSLYGRRVIVRNGRFLECDVPMAVDGVPGQTPEVLSCICNSVRFNFNVVRPMKADKAAECAAGDWSSFIDQRYACWWANGVDTDPRGEGTNHQRQLTTAGVTPDGTNRFATVVDGICGELKDSWAKVPNDSRARELAAEPLFAADDEDVAFWVAIDKTYPTTRHPRCWMHELFNGHNALPKRLQPKTKAATHNIWIAATEDEASPIFERSIAKYSKTAAKLLDDYDVLLVVFHDSLVGHWVRRYLHQQPDRIDLRHGAPPFCGECPEFRGRGIT